MIDPGIEGNTALLTGTNSGIGAAIAVKHASEGPCDHSLSQCGFGRYRGEQPVIEVSKL